MKREWQHEKLHAYDNTAWWRHYRVRDLLCDNKDQVVLAVLSLGCLLLGIADMLWGPPDVAGAAPFLMWISFGTLAWNVGALWHAGYDRWRATRLAAAEQNAYWAARMLGEWFASAVGSDYPLCPKLLLDNVADGPFVCGEGRWCGMHCNAAAELDLPYREECGRCWAEFARRTAWWVIDGDEWQTNEDRAFTDRVCAAIAARRV